jgi:large subunit ribosomal protein L4
MDVIALDGKVKGSVELPNDIFGRTGSRSLLWEAVKAYLANQTRGEVSGTGKKPYRQKHTGRARHGSRRSPIFVGGGVVFGPHPRDHRVSVPKKKRRQALRIALSARHAEGAVKVVEDFELSEPKTKELVALISGLGLSGSILLLTGETSEKLERASRNVPWLKVLPAKQLHTYAALNNENLVFTESGLKSFLGTTEAQ